MKKSKRKAPRVPLKGWEALKVDPQTMGDCAEGGLCGIEILDTKKCINLENFGILSITTDQSTLPFLKKKSRRKKKRNQNKTETKVKKTEKPKHQEIESQVEIDENVSQSWRELDLDTLLLSAIKKSGFEFPLPIQSYCIPAAIKQRKDVLGAAQTGSGKTLAFGIPIFQRLLEEFKSHIPSTSVQEETKSTESNHQEHSESEELEEIAESEDEEELEELDEEQSVDGVTRAPELAEDLAISNTEIAQLDKELGNVCFGDLFRKSDPQKCLKALILTPTRELALQASNQLLEIGQLLKIRVVPLVGGMAPQKQMRLLSYNPDVVVATPGRFLDLYRKGVEHLRDLSQLKFFVVDECDKMIRHGDFKDLTVILQSIPEYQVMEETYDAKAEKGKKRKKKDEVKYKIPAEERKMQTLLFSATLTLPRSLHRKLHSASKAKEPEEDVDEMAIALDHLRFRGEPVVIDLTSKTRLAEKIQEAYILTPEEKLDAYLYSIILKHPGRTLVFCNAIKTVRRLTECLRLLGLPAHPIHAAKQQSQRLKALDRFKANNNSVLVATDVASRGLDIRDVRCVIHYNVPHAADLYIHRSGRTARVEADGLALSLVTPGETLRFQALFKALGRKKPPEFPINQSSIPECMLRCQLARQVRDIDTKLSFRQKDEAWNKKTAETLQTQIEEDGVSDEEDLEITHLKEEREEHFTQLAHRLSVPLDDGLSQKFFTGDGKLWRHQGKEARHNTVDVVKVNIAKAKQMVKNTPKQKSNKQIRVEQSKADRISRHQRKLKQILDKKIAKKDKLKSLSYSKQKLVVIPPALGREAQGPDALSVMRMHLSKRQSSRVL